MKLINFFFCLAFHNEHMRRRIDLIKTIYVFLISAFSLKYFFKDNFFFLTFAARSKRNVVCFCITLTSSSPFCLCHTAYLILSHHFSIYHHHHHHHCSMLKCHRNKNELKCRDKLLPNDRYEMH